MPPRRVLAPLAIAALSTAFGGCSFAFVNGPPPNHRTSPFFTCTSGNGVPALDTIAAAIVVLDAVSLATDPVVDSASSRSKTENDIILGAGAAVLAASAAYGYKKAAECREAQADLLRRTPVFTGSPSPFAPRVPRGPQAPYDPWVAHPAPPAAPQAPVAPATAPAGGSSPWDGARPAQ
jgi:hypothetical protein